MLVLLFKLFCRVVYTLLNSHMSKDTPLWRSIRGVGLPPTHKSSRDTLELATVPTRTYEHVSTEARTDSPHIAVPAPKCNRCGLTADKHWPNDWYCHFCLEAVKAPLNPNSMIPVDSVDGKYLAPALSDPRGDTICPKCAVNRLPRIDNSGFECPKCGSIWNAPGVRRVSPTNGF